MHYVQNILPHNNTWHLNFPPIFYMHIITITEIYAPSFFAKSLETSRRIWFLRNLLDALADYPQVLFFYQIEEKNV